MDRVAIVHENFRRRVESADLPSGAEPNNSLTNEEAVGLYQAQVLSRQLDRISRHMQADGEGFYTIGSSGHEGMAAVAHALRPDDMAFLHYRDAAFQIARAQQVGHKDIDRDMLLSYACAAADPISGGRHKVLGSWDLMIPPQTSTIASHLPKALGAAFSIGAARRKRPQHSHCPADGIVICSFGDASLNHSTAQGAINTAGWTAFQVTPLPLLLVCEDNGIGISVKTPSGWVEASLRQRPGLRYFSANGLDLYATHAAAKAAADYVRTHRKPAVLHLRTVRLYGHAGADVATSYLPRQEVEADEANDPLLHSVRLLQQAGAMAPSEALACYDRTAQSLASLRAAIRQEAHLQTAQEVMQSLIPPPRRCEPRGPLDDRARQQLFAGDYPGLQQAQPMSRLLNYALTDLLAQYPEITLMGEDIGRKGGVYGVTQKLQRRFGPDRVIDTLLDEQSILGLAIGMAHNGFLPIPEIQFLAYLHNAEDQLRGEAATLPFFSNGQFTNPMVVRIAGLGYQKGFGGHFHNDNSLAVLRDIPGLIIACPSHGADAVRMLRESVRLAREEQRVVVFLEPIALYPMRDLHRVGDNKWMDVYPDLEERLPLGTVGVHGQGEQLALVSYANGYHLCRQAQTELEQQGYAVRVIDLRWLAPLPEAALLAATENCQRVLFVDECRKTGSQSEALITLFQEHGRSNMARLTAEDSFIATGPAYGATLPSRSSVLTAALKLLQG